MNQQHEEKLEIIFERVLAADRDERDAIISDACGEDADLRAEINRLLAAHDASVDLFDGSVISDALSHVDDEEQSERYIGQTIGKYRVTRRLGRGGMGLVFEAQQEDLHRPVALKIMRHGTSSRHALKRFRFEAEILASLHHPHIAQVYEAGMHDDGTGGVPYFAMEYISNAQPITKFAAERDLPLQQRIELFIKVCDAVHYGHQKGVMHRDLKPDNLVVDDQGEPKVIDFGVARATESDITLSTMQAGTGFLIGTVRYMSPEQCEGRSDAIDTRSDVYSLGVLLHELLTGELPYGEPMMGIFDSMHAIRDGRVQISPAHKRELRGDLQTIILTALENKPERRYQSADALAADLRRFLNAEPISATPPSRWQCACRWIARNPVVTTSAACLFIAATVLTLTFASVWYLGFRPDRIDVSPDRSRAVLLSAAGHTLHVWEAGVDKGIEFAAVVDVPDERGGGRLGLVGFGASPTTPYPATLCAFDLAHPDSEPLWVGHLEDDDLPPRVRARGFMPAEFRLSILRIEHVFAEFNGPQILAAHCHTMQSQCAIRIYDTEGRVMYQVWHDGPIQDFYWMDEPGLLIAVGLNGLVYWEERDHEPDELESSNPEGAHPHIIFAIAPQPGLRSTSWICPNTVRDDIINPAWYRCFRPGITMDIFGNSRLRAPYSRWNPRSHVIWDFALARGRMSSFLMLINEHGEEIREHRVIGDPYKRRDDLPDPSIFRLGDLPPLRPDAVIP